MKIPHYDGASSTGTFVSSPAVKSGFNAFQPRLFHTNSHGPPDRLYRRTSWDADYGVEYSIRSSQAPLARVISGPVVDTLRVTRDDLAARVATLDRDLRQSGGRLLARARSQSEASDLVP